MSNEVGGVKVPIDPKPLWNPELRKRLKLYDLMTEVKELDNCVRVLLRGDILTTEEAHTLCHRVINKLLEKERLVNE